MWIFFSACVGMFSSQEDDTELDILDWYHFNTNASTGEFISADDNLATCELRTVIISDAKVSKMNPAIVVPQLGEDALCGFIASAELSNQTAASVYDFQNNLLLEPNSAPASGMKCETILRLFHAVKSDGLF